jgi:puromycin-sensitive aminopeptidase
MALVARDPVVSEALRSRLDRFLGGDRGALEPNLQDAAVGVAARDGGPARFEEMLRLYREEKDPAFQRRYLLGLTGFEDASAVRRAVEMPFAGEVPLQDLASFAGGLLGNRSAADGFWALLRERWEPLQARLADAPLMTRRLVEGLGSLTTRRQLDEVRAFFSGRDVPAARQAIAQTTERLSLDVALWERIGPAVAAWLSARAGTAR